mmetsp:Transcript_224/g.1760  ORF Transcript_224/g.1760 Transcript_224/m.1760 type:complete len:390 (-) Transcript_224:2457-3626(-)
MGAASFQARFVHHGQSHQCRSSHAQTKNILPHNSFAGHPLILQGTIDATVPGLFHAAALVFEPGFIPCCFSFLLFPPLDSVFFCLPFPFFVHFFLPVVPGLLVEAFLEFLPELVSFPFPSTMVGTVLSVPTTREACECVDSIVGFPFLLVFQHFVRFVDFSELFGPIFSQVGVGVWMAGPHFQPIRTLDVVVAASSFDSECPVRIHPLQPARSFHLRTHVSDAPRFDHVVRPPVPIPTRLTTPGLLPTTSCPRFETVVDRRSFRSMDPARWAAQLSTAKSTHEDVRASIASSSTWSWKQQPKRTRSIASKGLEIDPVLLLERNVHRSRSERGRTMLETRPVVWTHVLGMAMAVGRAVMAEEDAVLGRTSSKVRRRWKMETLRSMSWARS